MSVKTPTEQNVLAAAQGQGVLPPDAVVPQDENPSWVLLVVSFIGAQLAVWPFMLFLGLTLRDLLFSKAGASLLSAIALAAGVAVLRKKNKGIFLTQLGFTVLLVGMGLFGVALAQFDLDDGIVPLLGLMLLALAFAVRVSWVQTLLGMAAALALVRINWQALAGWTDDMERYGFLPSSWLNLCVLTGMWWLWCARERDVGSARWQSTAHAVMQGMGVGLLLELLFLASTHTSSFSRWGGPMGSADDPHAGLASLFNINLYTISACLWVVAAGVWLAAHWGWLKLGDVQAKKVEVASAQPTVPERVLWLVLYSLWALLALVVRDLGLLAVFFTVALATGRRHMLVFALVVLLAQLSAFYYALQWPLVDKAALLAVLGAVLGIALWGLHVWGKGHAELAAKNTARPPALPHALASAQGHWPLLQRAGVALALLLALGISQWDAWRKEQVLAQGQKIYIPLVPRDPRSIMQGDYMALNFDLPSEVIGERGSLVFVKPTQSTILVVARLDDKAVATIVRRAQANEALAAGEVLLPLKYMKGDWVVVTNAYFFPEGKGRVFSAAKYGEFRVLGKGQVLLAGLADEKLQRIEPQPDAVAQDDLINGQ